MASKLLGRTVCPLCDCDSAHVKIKTDKGEGKEAFPYLHCRECDTQLHTRKQSQAAHLLRKTRPEKTDPPVPAVVPAAAPAPADDPEPMPPPAAQKPSLLAGWLP